MKLQLYFGKLKKPKLLFRRVVGNSMSPAFHDGQLVVGWRSKVIRAGNVVIARHNGLEKIKRVNKHDGRQVYLLGDNAAASTDSRNFGWLPTDSIIAKVIWPKG